MAAWQGSTRAKRLPADWPERRAQVLRRDRGICYLCGQPGADTVDHIIRGDNHALINLAAVHDRNPPHCHRAKTQAEAAAGRAAQAALAYHPRERHPGLR